MEGFSFEVVLADRGYDSNDILSGIEKLEAEAVIPARANRTEPRDTDWHLYKNRHLVECFINKIKHYRRIFSRFEKYAKRYMAFLHFVGTLIWLKWKCQHNLNSQMAKTVNPNSSARIKFFTS